MGLLTKKILELQKDYPDWATEGSSDADEYQRKKARYSVKWRVTWIDTAGGFVLNTEMTIAQVNTVHHISANQVNLRV